MINSPLQRHSKTNSQSLSPIKANLKKISQVVITATAMALLAGSLTPISAQATTPTNPTSLDNDCCIPTSDFPIVYNSTLDDSKVKNNASIADATELINIEKSADDLGEQSNPFFIVTEKEGANIPYLNYMSVNVYNVDTGKLVGNGSFDIYSQAQIDLTQFADQGVHHYIALTSYNGRGPENIEDFTGAIAKSSIINWERRDPFTIDLSYTNRFTAGEGGAEWNYSLNQELNQSEYEVFLFNVSNGKIPFTASSRNSKNGFLGYVTTLLERKSNQYRAILIDKKYINEENGVSVKLQY